MRMKLYLLLLILFLSGCSVNMLNLGLASTDRIDLNDNYERVSQINSKYRTYIFLYFPMGNPPRMDTLIGKALRENDVDFITNVTIDRKIFWLYFGGFIEYELQGIGWAKGGNDKALETDQIREIKSYDPDTGEPIYK